jgi:hypothetical protein
VRAVKSSQERQPSQAGRIPRRGTDRIEDAAAWLLTAVALFVVLFGALAGVRVHGDMAERRLAAERERVQVDAVLLTDAPPDAAAPGPPASRPARYVDGRGREHDVVLPVAGHRPAGSSVRAWVDRDGRVVPPPPSAVDAVVLGIVAAAAVVAIGGVVLEGVWLGVRRWLLLRNAAAWAHEWARVEPMWSGRDR